MAVQRRLAARQVFFVEVYERRALQRLILVSIVANRAIRLKDLAAAFLLCGELRRSCLGFRVATC